jgi:hypothetical protein
VVQNLEVFQLAELPFRQDLPVVKLKMVQLVEVMMRLRLAVEVHLQL